MQASAVRPKSRELKTVVFANRTTKKSKSKIFTMYVDSAVIIIACALRRAARPTANTLIAKKTATSAAPSTAPSSPLVPPTATLTTIMEQVVPHTFLRTRLLTHVFGSSPDDHKQAAATIRHVCERLQADRNDGKPAADGALVATFHRQLAEAYARDRATT